MVDRIRYPGILAAVDLFLDRFFFFRCLKASVEWARNDDGPKELVLLRRVVKLDAMHAFSETSLWNANTWGRVGTCMGTTIVRSCRCRIHADEFYAFHGSRSIRFQITLFPSDFHHDISQFSSPSVFLNVKNTLLVHFNFWERVLLLFSIRRNHISKNSYPFCLKKEKNTIEIFFLRKNWYWRIFDGWYSWHLSALRTLASRAQRYTSSWYTKH